MDSYSIKDNIRNFRVARGLSQQDMAERLNLSRTAYRQIETGSTQLISKHIVEIASVLGISLEECLLGYSPMDRKEMVARDQNPDNEYIKARFKVLEDRISALQEELSIKNESIKTLTDINNRLINQLG